MPKITPRSNATTKSASFHNRTPTFAKIIADVFFRCIKDSKKDLAKMLREFAYREGMSVSQARVFLNAPTDQRVVEALVRKARATGDQDLIRKVENQAFKLTYKRRDALRQICEINVCRSAAELAKGLLPLATDISKEAYGRTMFEIQRTIHVGFEVGGISPKAVLRAANAQIGYTRTTYYTARSIGKPLYEALTEGVLKGEHPDEIGMRISKVGNTVPWRAKGIARTAVTEIANDVEISTLKENGVEKYRFLATLDETTCPICGGMDNRVFDVSDKHTGTNCPPMHPNCRCTTTVAFTKTTLDKATRSAKDGNNKWTKVPAGMSYSQWKDKFLKQK